MSVALGSQVQQHNGRSLSVHPSTRRSLLRLKEACEVRPRRQTFALQSAAHCAAEVPPGTRLATVRYADGEKTCRILTNEGAEEAIRSVGAERFIRLLSPDNPITQELAEKIQLLWEEVVDVPDDDDDDFDYGDDWDEEDTMMMTIYETQEGSMFDAAEDDSFDEIVGSESGLEVDEQELASRDDVLAQVETASLAALRHFFPGECDPEFGGAVLRGADYSRYQVPDIMFRGADEYQRNYAEFLHRDIDTCDLPRDLKCAMPEPEVYSYRFYNIWISRSAANGQVDEDGQVLEYPVAFLLPRDGGMKEWSFEPPGEWDKHRLLHNPEHIFVTAPFVMFDSSDLWHGAVRWQDQMSLPEGFKRESIELRFRCRCKCSDAVDKGGCTMSPISRAYHLDQISDSHSRSSEFNYAQNSAPQP
ncbi:hypothetical protein CYMTET_39456 [Cymbomonas tetramitiformis]|uniref:Uncharacterized protein n=1 Tax=Cymbomonas tetramitiformis TaxID=36881 RepID=A0AAE0CB26_9CHLO|nr:hypothetical protein CYMTET_39456 [Cymbomonas tetramitiformis]